MSNLNNKPTTPNVKDDLLSNQLANEPTLREESFSGNVPKQVLETSPKTAKHRSLWRNLLVPAAAILILLALGFGGYAAWRNANQQAKDASVAERFGSTTFDLNNLNPSNTTANSGLVVINGNEQVNGNLAVEGSVTANSFSGNGADLSNVNATRLNSQPGSFYQDASNLDSGTLNDARLSGNVVLLGASPSFGSLTVSGSSNLLGPVTIQNTLLATGAVTFQSTLNVTGDVTIGGTTNINGLSYGWPSVQGNGVLSNDGAGNLAWQPVGACATCLTNGGNAFGSSLSVGTNDANSLQLRTNGSTQVTVTTTGDVGIGLNPGYKLDVNGDVNVSAGNAFRIGGTAICTSGGCAASAGSTDYVQNSASLQTGVNFNFEIASVNSVGGIIRAKAGQVSDLQQWQDSGGVALAAVDAGGHFVATTLGATDTATYLCRNSSNQIAACSGSASGAAFVQGGNSFGATATLGTNDANGLAFETNNTVRVTIPSGTNGFTFGAAGDTNLYRLAAGTLATDSILSVRDATDTYVNINPNGTITLAETLGPTSATLDYSHLGFSDSTSYVQIGSSTATTGALRLVNNSNIAWRNAANSANFTLGLNSSNVLETTASIWVNKDGDILYGRGGAGQLRTALNYSGANEVLTFSANGVQGMRVGNNGNVFIGSGAIGITQGSVEKLRVTAAPTTVDNAANAIFVSSATTSKPLVIQGVASQSANLFETQSSSGVVATSMTAAGVITTTLPGGVGQKITVTPTLDATYGYQMSFDNASGNQRRLVFGAGSAIGNVGGFGDMLYLSDVDGNQFSSATQIWGQGASGAGTFTNYTERMRLTANQFGIATTTFGGTRAYLSVRTPTTADNAAVTVLSGNATTDKVLVIQGVASQTANLQEWQASTGTALSYIDASGNLSIGSNPNAVGSIKLANGAYIRWTNAAGSGSYGATLNSSDQFVFERDITNATASGSVLTSKVGINASGSFDASARLRVNTLTTGDPSAVVEFATGATTAKGLVIQGVASQSANLQEWQDSSGTILSLISASGNISLGTNAATSGKLNFPNNTDVRWRNVANSGDIGFKLTNSDFFLFGAAIGIGLGNNSSTGSLRLPNAASIGWRNAANSANKLITLNSSDVLDMPGVITVGGSDSTAGQINFFSNTVRIARSASSGLVFYTNSGNLRAELNSSGTLGLNTTSLFTSGTVEKLRVNNITTIDNSANAVFNASDTTSKPLVIQGVSSQTANLQEWQNSSGTVLASVDASGNGSFGGGTFATSGGLRLANNVNLGWRNAGNTGNITAGVNASDIFQVTSPAADGSTVAQFNNAGATNCTVQPGGTGFACSSDERLKTNIMNLESGDATELVNKLQGVSFNWITNPDGQTQVGFVAQDLMKYIPSAVSKDSNGYYVANYSAIIPYLVEAFKKQQSQIDTLKSQNGTSVDVLKTLADAKAVTLSGDLTVGGNVVVKGRIEASSDNTGSVTIPAGQTSVHVALPSAFSKKPKVNLTPEDFVDGQYRVTNITKTGFTIELQKAQSSEVLFDWQAL